MELVLSWICNEEGDKNGRRYGVRGGEGYFIN